MKLYLICAGRIQKKARIAMRKIYCDLCEKDITDDEYKDFEISTKNKDEET